MSLLFVQGQQSSQSQQLLKYDSEHTADRESAVLKTRDVFNVNIRKHLGSIHKKWCPLTRIKVLQTAMYHRRNSWI